MARKKPRRRRQLVKPTQPDPIPYSKYRIEWIDIISDSGWADKEEDGSFTFGDRTMIPRACIKKMIRLS